MEIHNLKTVKQHRIEISFLLKEKNLSGSYPTMKRRWEKEADGGYGSCRACT